MRLALASNKGNAIRYFPHTGYLGLTPVTVEGVVMTRLDQDQKPMPTRSISVALRCYLQCYNRAGSVVNSSILAETSKTLFEHVPGAEKYADVGDLDLPFRLTLPARVGGGSTTSVVEFRIIWRVEAVLNHMYVPGVGSRQIKHSDLPLVRYDVPSPPPNVPRPAPAHAAPQLNLDATTKSRAARLRYSIVTPSTPIGPMDLVSISMHLLPSDTSVSVRSASAIVERRILVKDAGAPPTTPSQPGFAASASSPYGHCDSQPLASSSSLASSNPTITPAHFASASTLVATEQRPLLTAQQFRPSTSTSSVELGGARSSIHPIAGTESSGAFQRDQDGTFSKTLTIPWPIPKSSGRWAIGETIQTDLISVKFFVRVKVIVTSSSGTESLDLEERELFVVSSNEAERQLALSNYNDSQPDTTRSKSKSPRRSRKALDDERSSPAPTPTPQRPVSRPTDHASSSRPSSSHGSKPKSSRRPHTSAGPRDTASKFSSSKSDAHPPPHDIHKRVKYTRPGTMDSGNGGAGPIRTRDSIYAPRMTPVPSGSSTSSASMASMTTGTTASSFSSQHRGSADIREWEQELARIELQSRRSSDMLGFGMKRHRPSTANRILIAGDS